MFFYNLQHFHVVIGGSNPISRLASKYLEATMAYYIYDYNGLIDSGPSIGGLRDLKADLDKHVINAEKFPQMALFLKQGFASSPIRFRIELIALEQIVKDETVKSSLTMLANAVSKCKEIVILRDSLG